MKFPILLPIFLILYEFILNLSNDSYISALVNVGDSLHVSSEYMQSTVAAYLAGAALFQLILGPISDRFGRNHMLLTGGIVFLVSTAICGTTSNLFTLIIGRFFQGLALSSFLVSGYSAIPEAYNQKNALRIFTWMTAITVLSPMLGPIIGGYIVHYRSWRDIFFLLLILAILVLIPLAFLMPKRKIYLERKLSFLKLHEIYTGFLRSPKFLFPTLSYSFSYSALIAWITSSPYIIMDSFNETPISFGFMQMIVFGGYALGALFIRPFLTQFVKGDILHFGLFFALLNSILLFIYTLLFAEHLSIVLFLMTFVAFGCSLSFATLSRRILVVSRHHEGSALAVYSFFNMGIASLTSLIIAFLPDTSLYFSGLITLLIILSLFFSFKI